MMYDQNGADAPFANSFPAIVANANCVVEVNRNHTPRNSSVTRNDAESGHQISALTPSKLQELANAPYFIFWNRMDPDTFPGDTLAAGISRYRSFAVSIRQGSQSDAVPFAPT